MATMISEVYDALLEAGAGEEKARRAAEVLADYDPRFNRVEGELVALNAVVKAGFTRLDPRIDKVEGSISNLRAIVAIVPTITLANLGLTGALFANLFH